MSSNEARNIGTLATGIAHVLEERIREGSIPSGRALPSERDLANEFDVSRGVIRAAIEALAITGLILVRPNHRPIVKPKSRESFRPPSGIRNLAVWLWPSSGHFSAATILKGIQSTNLGPNVQVTVGSGAGNDWASVLDSEKEFLLSVAANPSTLGIIIWYLGGKQNLDALQALKTNGVPIVFVDRLPPDGFEVDYVGTNNVDSAIHAVQRLLSLGHRRIGMISNIDPASSVAEREEGYIKALTDAGIAVEDDWIQRTTYDEPEGVTASVEALRNLDDPVTAVFCVNDLLALNVHLILERMGVSVPREFSVIGFDGLLRWVPGGGYLTTMSQDFERMGRTAATLIADRIAGKVRSSYRHYLLDAPLIPGTTTAAPRKNAKNSTSALGHVPNASSMETYHE